MKTTTKKALSSTAKKALKSNVDVFSYSFVKPDGSKELAMVKGAADIKNKLAYIDSAYDENLVHKENPKGKILKINFGTNDFGLL